MNIRKIQRPTDLNSGTILISTVFTILILLSATYILAMIYHPVINIHELRSLFIEEFASKVNPKPKEKLIFTTLLFALPVICFFSLKLSRTLIDHISLRTYQIIISIFTFILCLNILYIIQKLDIALLLGWPLLLQPLALIATYGAAFLIYYYSYKRKHFFSSNTVTFARRFITPLIALFVILLPCLVFRVANINLVNDHAIAWATDFEAVFYNVSQIVAGKTLLIDLPAQYGLYGEILYPFFKMIPLSIFSFTLMMALLQITALLCVYQSLINLIKNHLLVLSCLICICMTECWFMYNGLGYTPYYQYFPIRTFFPMVSCILFLFLLQQKSPSIRSVVLFSAFCALATLWNLDSGIPIFGALLAYITSFTFFPSIYVTRKMSLVRTSASICAFVFTITLFLFFLYVKGHQQPLNLNWLFKYQQIFYQSGYMMLPLPTALNAWQIVYYIYIVGLSIGIFHWIKNSRTVTSDMYFILSMLGFGLFMYFEGRSHTFNLANTAWPAFIMMFMIAEKIARLSKNELINPVFILFSNVIVLYGIYIVGDYFLKMPAVISQGASYWKTMLVNQPSQVQRNLDFIKKHYNNSSVVIISPIQSIYYAAINHPSAIAGPGRVETILKADNDYFASQLAQAKTEVVFLQLDDAIINSKKYLPYLQNYTLMSVSADGLAYFVKKKM